MVTYHLKDGHPQPKDGHPSEGSVLETWNLAPRLKLKKITPGDNCHGWSPTMPRMVTHQPEDDHYRLGIWYLDLNSQN